MKLNQTQKLVLNQVGRCGLAILAGAWVTKTTNAVLKTEEKPINKIVISLGSCVAAFAIGNSLDQVFNKLPPYNEEGRLVIEDEDLMYTDEV